MGLFGGLFDKKSCAICHGEIGLLGNRKLEDGNLCKHCAAKLSPWFSDRRHSTVAEIADQLAYREANRERVAAFHATRTYGEDRKLYIDDTTQTIAVTSSSDFMRDNPDIVDYAAVTGCRPEIDEQRWEVRHKDDQGHEVPFDPPRFRYEYNFWITLTVNTPYFDEMRFKLNSWDVKGEDRDECLRFVTMTEDVVETMTGVRPDLSNQVPDRRPAPPKPPMPERPPMPEPHHAPAPAPREPQQPRPNGAHPGPGPKPNGPRG